MCAHFAWYFDDPRRRDDDDRVDSHGALLLELLHHEAGRLVVVGRLAPRTADGDDVLEQQTQPARVTSSNNVNKQF